MFVLQTQADLYWDCLEYYHGNGRSQTMAECMVCAARRPPFEVIPADIAIVNLSESELSMTIC